MTAQGKTVSVIDIAKGAIGFLPDVPQIIPSLASLASLRPNARRSMGLLFQEMAHKYAKHTFLKSGTESWTYAQANSRCNQMARGLLAMGVRAGDTVGLLSVNRADTLLVVIACAKLGAVAALLNINQRGDVQAHSLKLVKTRLVLACDQGLDVLKQMRVSHPSVLEGMEILPLHAAGDWSAQPAHNLAQTTQIIASSPCFYIFTSGTTGLPKASVMSHYRWLQAAQGMRTAVRLNSNDVLYCCLPLYHNNALTVSLGVVVASGACLALDEKFSASQFWLRIKHYQVTAFCYIGELLRYLMNQPQHMNDQNHEVRLILGNGLRPEIWNDFEKRFGIRRIFEFYGASESNLGFMNAFGLTKTVGFCPMPFEVVACDTDTEQPMRNRQGFCQSVGRGQVGLLISKVTALRPFDGYTDPQANEGKLLRNVFRKGDCWFNSGDLVRRQGWQHIQFVDRLGDTFRWKGENVATSEVEGVLATLPFLEHAVVYGVTVEGADGRAGMAAVAVKAGHSLDMDALATQVVSSLPSYAVPQFVRVLELVETTGTFKYQKVQLKKEGASPAAFSGALYQFNAQRKTYDRLA